MLGLKAVVLARDWPAREVERLEDLRRALASGDWLRVAVDTSADRAAAERVLGELFGFHPLTIEDALTSEPNPPKLDEHDRCLFLLVHALIGYEPFADLATREVCLYLGPHLLVSCHHGLVPSLDAIRRRYREDGLPLRRGAEWVLHANLDELADEELPCIEAMEESLDRLVADVLEGAAGGVLEQVLRLRTNAVRLRRLAIPQRELLEGLSRPDFPHLVGREATFYFRDVYDHLVRIGSLTEALRELTENALHTHLTVVSNHLTEVTKVLAAAATSFLPLALISGVYGMNFAEHVSPPFASGWGFPDVVGTIAALGFTMAAVLCRWGWL